MILYNVTVKIDNAEHDNWLAWMTQQHIPDVMRTGCFVENRVSRMLIPTDPDNDGVTYSIQYLCQNMAILQRYQAQFAPALQQDHTKRYEGKFVAFRTVMEVVSSTTTAPISHN